MNNSSAIYLAGSKKSEVKVLSFGEDLGEATELLERIKFVFPINLIAFKTPRSYVNQLQKI